MVRLLIVVTSLAALIAIRSATLSFYVRGARMRNSARAGHGTASPNVAVAPSRLEESLNVFPLDANKDCSSSRGLKAAKVASKTIAGGKMARRKKRQSLSRGDEQTMPAEEEAEEGCAKKDEKGEEEEESSKSSAMDGNHLQPFYLKDLPPTRVTKLFQGYERRYWDARREGLDRLGNHRKFFTTNRAQGLTDAERDEFRRLARRFTDKLSDKKPGKLEANLRQRRKRYGIGEDKTEAQKEATHRKSRRNHLSRRLRKINTDLERGIVKMQWNDNNNKMLQDLVAETPLKPGDVLLELYKKYLELSHTPSCIELPS